MPSLLEKEFLISHFLNLGISFICIVQLLIKHAEKIIISGRCHRYDYQFVRKQLDYRPVLKPRPD